MKSKSCWCSNKDEFYFVFYSFSQEKIVEGQFDENANDEFHTPSKLQIKNGEHKTPRTPKPTWAMNKTEISLKSNFLCLVSKKNKKS